MKSPLAREMGLLNFIGGGWAINFLKTIDPLVYRREKESNIDLLGGKAPAASGRKKKGVDGGGKERKSASHLMLKGGAKSKLLIFSN